MIFTRYSLQFERALKNLTPNTERATKKQNAFWAGFRKKEESYYFFPDPVILINNEPSLNSKVTLFSFHLCMFNSSFLPMDSTKSNAHFRFDVLLHPRLFCFVTNAADTCKYTSIYHIPVTCKSLHI